MKKIWLTLLLLFSCLFLFVGCSDEGDVEEESGGGWFSDTVDSKTNTKAAQDIDADSATILVYMVASDLESEAGCASTDIEEMCNATFGDNVNVVLQTGGSTYWVNENMDASKVERFVVKNGNVKKVETVGKCKKISMVDKDTLSDFISWGVKNYPADRYGVILWNHGGGSIMGFGVDEYHGDDSLSVLDISKAFKEAYKKTNVKMNFVGFDACLMGTIETAYALYPYADYMIASEETEPGSGWYYTNWLTTLSDNPGINMKALGKEIISDFLDGPDSSVWDSITLALYDLSDTKNVYKELCSYMSDARKILKKKGFKQMASARSSITSYGDDEYEQVDIKAYLDEAGEESDSLKKALDNMIVTYGGNVTDSNGLAMYYPYSYLNYYSDMNKMIDKLGMDDEEYLGYFNDFVSILSKGQTTTSSSGNESLISQLLGVLVDDEDDTDYTNEEWYEEDVAENEYDEDATFDSDEELTFEEKGDNYVLSLTEESWDSIAKVEMELYVKDGDGYLAFGRDSLVDFDDDGDLVANFDWNWVHINGQYVPFYIVSDEQYEDQWQATGYVPATLNEGTKKEKDISLFVRWDSQHEEGYVMGYVENKGDEDAICVAAKNYLKLKAGDTLDFYCEYYTSDGEYENSYYVGDTLKVPKSGVTVGYEELPEDLEIEFGYILTDYYQNEYYTEIMTY